jgi:predicted transcriptional regulator
MEQNRWLKVKLKKIFDTNQIHSKHWMSVGIANFQETAVPNFIINLVIKSEIKKTKAIILCDRTGGMMTKWGFRNGRSNIYLVDKNRILRWKTSGPLSKKQGNRLIRLLRRLVRQ